MNAITKSASALSLPARIGPTNALTVDVEDYFQVEAFSRVVARERWDAIPSRVEANVDRILTMFAAAGVSATFFTLGWVADRHPAIIRRIVSAGHELASHGYGHARVDRLDPEAFRADISRARQVLEDIGGVAVTGYRAPTFSIRPPQRVGFRGPGGDRSSIQFKRLPGSTRPLWRPRRAAAPRIGRARAICGKSP